MKKKYDILMQHVTYLDETMTLQTVECIAIDAGALILFPIFYVILLGVLTGPQVFKVFKPQDVDAATNGCCVHLPLYC